MLNSKLISLLVQLNTRERGRFGALVHSPVFNKHKKLRELSDYLLTLAPDFEEKLPGKPEIFNRLYPQQAYNEDHFNNLLSDLLQLLYSFLVQLQLESRPLIRQKWLVEELIERDMPRHAGSSLRRLEQLSRRSGVRSAEYYLAESAKQELADRYRLEHGRREYNVHLQKQSDALDLYYYIDKLRIACNMASRNRVINARYESRLLPQLIELIPKSELLIQNPVLQIYFQTLNMLEAPEGDAHFNILRELMEQHGDLFPRPELRTLYHYILNFCIHKINRGDSRFYRETLEIYNTMLRKEIIFEKKTLSQWSFKNIVTTGLRLNEYEWTEQFIQTYKDRLPPEDRFNAVTYNLAACHYARGSYQEALLQLQDVEFSDPSYHLGAKIIQLKCYYELGEIDPLFDLISAFSQYLRRNRQISDYRKDANANFLKVTRRLGRLRSEHSTLDAGKWTARYLELRDSLSEIQPIANKEWLMEALKRLYPASRIS